MIPLSFTSEISTSQFIGKDFCWASMSDVIGQQRMRSRLDQFKYLIRYSLTHRIREKFLSRVSDIHLGRSLFTANPNNFYVPLRSYLDKRFTVKERFDACLVDIETAKTKFGIQISERLLSGESIKLLDVGHFSLHLQLNRVSQFEGFWAVTVKDELALPISNLSFGFLNNKTILIASVQGMKSPNGNILEQNKRLTKDAFGLRPPNLLVAAMQSLCQAWQVDQLLGIDPKNQVKRKFRSEKQGFKFDYSQFWSEIGARKNFSGYWTLAVDTAFRNLHDIPSHKRSQYKKRNALLEQMNLNVSDIFAAKSTSSNATHR